MGANSSKRVPCLPNTLTGPVKVMEDKWGGIFWNMYKVADFSLKGTLSEILLAECRKNFEETMKGKTCLIDWGKFRKW